MVFNRALFSSASGEWRTPEALFEALEVEFGPFDLDPATSDGNALCARSFTEQEDGLRQPWAGRVFVNPPYGEGLYEWLWKCHTEAQRPGVTLIVALLPSRTDVRWFHDFVLQATEIRFIKGRLRFQGAADRSPFPSMLVIWDGSGPVA